MSNQRVQIANTDTGEVAIVIEAETNGGRTRYTLPMHADSARYLNSNEVPAGIVTVEVDVQGQSIRENVQVAHLRPPAQARKAGGKRPGVGIKKPTTASSGPGEAASRGVDDTNKQQMHFAISRGEAFQDTGQWLSEDGWVEDRVWLQASAEVEGKQPESPEEEKTPTGTPGTDKSAEAREAKKNRNKQFEFLVPTVIVVVVAVVASLVWVFFPGGDSDGGLEIIQEGDGYEVYANGTVFDKESELQWTLCVVGQEWTEEACSGSAEPVAWEDMDGIVEQANSSGMAEHADWRAPRMEELERYHEFDLGYDGVDVLWSSTEQRGLSGFAQALDQSDGSIKRQSVDREHAVKLVREPVVQDGSCQDC